MKLSAYLINRGLSDADFAKLIGVSRQAVHRYKSGDRWPDRTILAKIKLVTGGAVLPDDFLSTPVEAAE